MRESSTVKTVRRYSHEFKALVLTECEQTGAVIKAVAQKHGVPISLVHKWRYKAERSGFTNLNSAISGNSGHLQGVSHGQEISKTHESHA
jgi:transposase-like protein